MCRGWPGCVGVGSRADGDSGHTRAAVRAMSQKGRGGEPWGMAVDGPKKLGLSNALHPFSNAVQCLRHGRSVSHEPRGTARTPSPIARSPAPAPFDAASSLRVRRAPALLGALPHLAALALKAPCPLLLPLPPELGPRLLVRVGLVRHGERHSPVALFLPLLGSPRADGPGQFILHDEQICPGRLSSALTHINRSTRHTFKYTPTIVMSENERRSRAFLDPEA